jgi:hypothetical protein
MENQSCQIEKNKRAEGNEKGNLDPFEISAILRIDEETRATNKRSQA